MAPQKQLFRRFRKSGDSTDARMNCQMPLRYVKGRNICM